MKACILTSYGDPSTALTLKDIPIPTPKPTQVLIKIHAASLNAADWHIMRADPFPIRLMTGLMGPSPLPIGSDVAGVVERVGDLVGGVRVGDRVFLQTPMSVLGACAEFVCVGEEFVTGLPSNMSFEEAAAVPMAACTAYQGLVEAGKVCGGKRVLINGASGGVGSFAVQIAKALGAEVTAVCSSRNLELVRGLGADHVVDYTVSNFTEAGETGARYDVIFDTVSTRSFSECCEVLGEDGIYVFAGGVQKGMGSLWHFLDARLRSLGGGRTVVNFLQMPTPGTAHLKAVRELIEAGKVRAVIDRRFGLEEVPDAMAYLEEGHVRGKIVVNVVV
ncbi:hypothetical protein HDU67_001304 [Dinochytrium kinnereticum]|nr:hypothetical protein HDU67_001304 [Dinochytrium kinnereticum]